jgi:vacuolar-type H+-ATPase subunit E/Vma4
LKIRCREQDVADVQAVLPEAQQECRTKLNDTKLTLSVDTQRLSKDDVRGGGVMAVGYSDRIQVNNTMDCRMEMAFEQNLPLVRKIMFGAPATAS